MKSLICSGLNRKLSQFFINKYAKRLSIILFFAFGIYGFSNAQEAPISPIPTPTVDHKVIQDPQLNLKNQKAKVLFEKTHKVSLTLIQYKDYLQSSTANLVKWEKVLSENKNNPAIDISYVIELVRGMRQKRDWKKE